MGTTFGTKETKELVVFVFKATHTIKLAKENDGKLDISDMALFFALIPQLGPAFDNVGSIPKELSDLSSEEAAELQSLVLSEIGTLVGDAKIVSVIEKSLKLVHCAYDLFQTVKS